VCNDICRTLNLPPLGPPGAAQPTARPPSRARRLRSGGVRRAHRAGWRVAGARRNTSSEDLRRMTPGHMAGGQSERERDAALRQLRGAQAEPDFPRCPPPGCRHPLRRPGLLSSPPACAPPLSR
jgi:hypothetical protein